MVKNLFIFKNLKENEKAEIISLLEKPIFFKKGEIIYSKENFKKALGFIVSGKAVALCENSGQLFMNSFGRAETFGAASIFGENDFYVSSIIAKTDCEVLFLSEDFLTQIFKSYPQTSLNYIKFLSDKIRFLNTKLNLISCKSAEDTLLSYFKTICDENGEAVCPKNFTSLSKTLGLSRASLYRCIEKLENENKIIKTNNIIKVIENEKNS